MEKFDKIQIDVIPQDAIIDLKVSGAFYLQLKALLFDLSKDFTPEKFLEISKNIKEQKPLETAQETFVVTMTALIVEIEKQAQSQSKTVKQDFDASDFAK